jgi:hypothetical protein
MLAAIRAAGQDGERWSMGDPATVGRRGGADRRRPRWRGARRGLALGAGLVLAASSLAGCGTPAQQHVVAGCERADLGGRSVARAWDEEVLSLIRQVVPAPGVHARNLFHTSVGMWDAWAAYDPTADGYLVTEKHRADDVTAARETAISYAAYRVLLWRYAVVSDLAGAQEQLDGVMASLCYRTDYTTTEGDDPAALGNRIAAAVLEHGKADGSLEEQRYADLTYQPVNPPLEVAEPGTSMVDPDRWQPLSLAKQIAQNGLEIPGQVQEFIGPHWGHVAPFALPETADGVPIDPGPPPRLADPATRDELRREIVDVIRKAADLDATDGVTMDIGPGAYGDNPLGTNDGDGHDVNPATGEPYAPDVVLRGDFARVLAEYWADGPRSETPPGHWNLFANAVSDAPGFERRIGGTGPELDPLEWDVKLYLALNGAVHDAAIAAWGLKGAYDSARPISYVRYMGGRGQSSDPALPSYDPVGLLLEPGLIEVITPESSAPGERHAHLADHVGEIAVRSWLGSPEDPETQTSGVGWIRAVEWVPYQRATFVTPGFAGYVSGHSTFSRAAAEVLAAMTGSEYFPGGLMTYTKEAGSLIHEEGPTADVPLQWATYYDAADQAGISRIYGGIHIAADDVEGRKVGSQVGLGAWELAQQYYAGTAGE